MKEEFNLPAEYKDLLDILRMSKSPYAAKKAIEDLKSLENPNPEAHRYVASELGQNVLPMLTMGIEQGYADQTLTDLEDGVLDEPEMIEEMKHSLDTMIAVAEYVMEHCLGDVSEKVVKAVEDVQALSAEERADLYTMLKTISDAIGRNYQPYQAPKGPQL